MSKVILPLSEFTNRVQIVGSLKQEITDLLCINLPPADILIYPGAIKHIKKNHEESFIKYFQYIPEIINSPDYVGVNPSEPNSVEFVKIFSDNILVAVKLDPKGYLYLSSMYELTPVKVPKRIKNGRLKKFTP